MARKSLTNTLLAIALGLITNVSDAQDKRESRFERVYLKDGTMLYLNIGKNLSRRSKPYILSLRPQKPYVLPIMQRTSQATRILDQFKDVSALLDDEHSRLRNSAYWVMVDLLNYQVVAKDNPHLSKSSDKLGSLVNCLYTALKGDNSEIPDAESLISGGKPKTYFCGLVDN
jgi:hypothetical protein